APGSLVDGGLVPDRWWESFECKALNTLVEQALAHSPNALAARARLREAQENLNAQSRGTLYPSVDAQFGVTRQKIDPASFGIPNIPTAPPFTLYNAQVNVFYTLDFFGGNRRAIEGLRAQRDYQNHETQAAELTLAAHVVAAAIRQADLQEQVQLNVQLLQAESRQYEIAEERYRVGGIALEALQSQRAALEQLRAALPLLTAQREQVDHELAVYIGTTPAEARIPPIRIGDLHLPAAIPLTLPADLVRRRPDVQAYEALWHQASANVGVATAKLFPTMTLSGYAGSDRTNASDLVDSLNVWSIGAKLMQPIFHAGELRAQRRSAVAAYDAAAHAYEETVLESLQQVADGLRAMDADARVLQARSAALERSASNYSIAEQRFDVGGISELSLLDAKRDKLESSLDRSRAEAQRLADTAALLHAMAGPI
ncbi:MAG: efflux transporter outer membrane subunit, partial [Terriglobales bacterium]